LQLYAFPVPRRPSGWFGKALLAVLAAWLLTIAWFWVVAPTVDAPNGSRMICANFPIIKTLTGHPDRPEDPSYNPPSTCQRAEDHASRIGFYILGAGIVALLGVALLSGRFAPSARKLPPSEVGAS
jgi:hypothetical protein